MTEESERDRGEGVVEGDVCTLGLSLEGTASTVKGVAGAGVLCAELESSLLGRRVGERWQVGMAAEKHPLLPPRTSVEGLLSVELLEKSPSPEALATAGLLLRHAIAQKVAGNASFREGRPEEALEAYQSAASALLQDRPAICFSEEQAEEREALLTTLWLNCAQCWLLLKRPGEALKPLYLVLELDPLCPKANLRAGRAEAMLCNFDSARRYYSRALAAAPDDPAPSAALRQLAQAEKAHATTQAKAFSNMFS